MDDLVKRADAALEGVTPGPWGTDEREHTEPYQAIRIGPSGNYRVSRVWLGDCAHGYNPEQRANARFIVAARELVPLMRDRIAELEDAISGRTFSLDEGREWKAKAEAAEARVKQLEADNARFRKLLEAWLEVAEHCQIEEGVCCCGESMEGHSNPMDWGHSPVDHGSYIASELEKETRAALEGEKT